MHRLGEQPKGESMTAQAGSPRLPAAEAECWCCGIREGPDKLVHLENHPEVAICTRCAHSLHTWAWELEDAAKTGAAVRARDVLRQLRQHGQEKGWQHKKIIGRRLRWLGKHLP
jgi:hypothetical protein